MSDESPDQPLQQPIPEELTGLRFDQALAQMFPEFSRSRLKSWILKGRATLDGESVRPKDAVMAGQAVEVRPLAELAVTSKPEPIELTVAYEDDDLLVIDKPVGLVVHPGAGNLHGTLMNGLLYHAAALADLPRAGIVHRLDKDTSGLMLVGKTLEAHTELVRRLADRDISREYLAVCNGVLTGGGTIDAPIGRHPVDRRKMHISDQGKPSVSHYRVLQRFDAHTLVRVILETGRTHQIRVHFAHRRHPLVGDQTYGGRLAMPAGARPEVHEVLRSFRRQALHAEKLSLDHPITGERLELQADPPADFINLMNVLGNKA